MFSPLLLLTTLGLATTAIAQTSDGFPNPNAEQLRSTSNRADGSLSNAPPPATLNASSIPIFQLLAFNEHFEVAFFSSLINNISTNVPGYELEAAKKAEVLEILDTVLAQEQLHAINAQNTLKRFNGFVPVPCRYQFPTTDLKSAIRLADKFTDVVLGTLQDAAQSLARNGDVGPVRGVASSLGQEGQQSGFYRTLLNKKPSEKPFLTVNVAPFAFSLLQQFVVPGSCPFDLGEIKLSVFPALDVLDGDNIQPKNQQLKFKADLSLVNGVDQWEGQAAPKLWITYFSGQLLPISVPVSGAVWEGRKVTFGAEFPFEDNIMVGLSVASLTTRNGFTSPGEVVGAAIAAPGLVQVDDVLSSWDGIDMKDQ